MDEIITQTPPIIEPIPEIIPKKKLPIWVWTIPLLFIILLYIIFRQQQLLNTNKQPISENIIPTTEPTQIPSATPSDTTLVTPTPTTLDFEDISTKIAIELLEEKYFKDLFSVEIEKREGNFALLAYSNAHHIWKKENGKWRHLTGTNGDWPCDILLKENVPGSLINNECNQ